MTHMTRALFFGLTFSLGTLLPFDLPAANDTTTFLWRIGAPDDNNAEFALAPNRYSEFREDGFFVVGKSDPKRDWPYVQPGPADVWAGGRQHTFSIVFGLKTAPSGGTCRFHLEFLDVHRSAPPRLKISINGHESSYSPEGGAGDQTIQGQPKEGQARDFDVTFEPTLAQSRCQRNHHHHSLRQLGAFTIALVWKSRQALNSPTPAAP